MSFEVEPPFPVFNDRDGTPLENGKIYIGETDLNPITNPIQVYWDEDLTQPAAQPIRTIGGYPNKNGSPSQMFVSETDYSISVYDKNDVFVYSKPDKTSAFENVYNVKNAMAQYDTVAIMVADTGVQNLEDNSLIMCREYTNVIPTTWVKTTADPGTGFVLAGVNCFLQQQKSGTNEITKTVGSFVTVIDVTPIDAETSLTVQEAFVDLQFRISGKNEITLLQGESGSRDIVISSGLSTSENQYRNDESDEFRVNSIREQAIGKSREVAKLSPWSDSPVNIIGDSISQGANATDAPRQSWTSLIKRMTMADSRNTNWGFISLNDQIGGGAYKDIATVTRSGTWTDKTLSDAADSISGYYLSSSTVTDYLEIELPMGWNSSYIWFKGRSDGATLDVQSNGVSVGTLITSAVGDTSGYLKFGPYTNSDDTQGKTVLKLEITGAGTADLIGISELQDVFGPQVNNFSQSGRQFEFFSDADMIEKAFDGAKTVVLALGANDYTDDASESTIVANADLVIAEANTQGTKLIVADFVWYRKLNNFMRRELKRIADSVEGAVYLPFPDWFYTDPTTTPDSSYLINDLKLFDDAIHPNKSGHKFIADAVALAMGIEYGRDSGLSSWGLWWPLEMQGSATNTFINSQFNSAVMEDSNGIHVRLFFDLPGAPTAGTTTVVAQLPSWLTVPYTDYRVFGGDNTTNDLYKISIAFT